MPMSKETVFFKALQDIFIGAKIEGIGGFINLMRIKSHYYAQIEKLLKTDIDNAIEKFPSFREELFDKLYSFFNRYFTQNGSIYFSSTPFHNDIYERVYTDEKDVILFWKTQMLYYVKTDRIFKSMPVEIDNFRFYFDAGQIEGKRSNEKRTLIYRLKQVREDGTIVFGVAYSERGAKNRIDEITRALRGEHITISEELLERAFSIFQRQSEVDYFINKNARAFLEEQFKLWSYQYFWQGAKEWPTQRINQLQVLKEIAFKIIGFIAQFEDELVHIWNKPKFVRKSNYVISLKTLKSIIAEKEFKSIRREVFKLIDAKLEYKKDIIETVREVYKQPLRKVYVRKAKIEGEVINLEYARVFDEEEERATYLARNTSEKPVNEDIFDRKNKIDGYLATIHSKSLVEEVELEKAYIDTAYLSEELKGTILEAISRNKVLDDAIDGYLIKSDNYHFLKSPNKFRSKIRLIYIDPPFNTEGSGYAYLDKFKDSTWLSMIQDRVQLAYDLFLTKDGSFYIHLDSNCNYLSRYLLDNIFKKEPDREIMWNTGEALSGFKTQALNWIRQHDTIFYYSKEEPRFNKMWVKNDKKDIEGLGWLDIFKDDDGSLYVYKYKDGQSALSKTPLPTVDIKAIGDMWNDVLSLMYTQNMTRENWGQDNTQKPENLLRRIIQSSTNERDFVLDYFVGSGTTVAAAHKLNRRWIGIEMGEFIESIVMKRMKTVVFGDIRPKLSEDLNWQGGGFFKYYELEQYEDALSKCKYSDGDLFDEPSEKAYLDYVFLKDEKMLEALNINYKKNRVNVEMNRLYEDIDIAETLSNLYSKPIRSIIKDEVEFVDGSKINIEDLDYKMIRPLIWW
jgi:adenine specific DNA methylase Mod